ncbi:MAG: hypothetical protein ACRCUB_11055 [Plesiomonas shigelloides]
MYSDNNSAYLDPGQVSPQERALVGRLMSDIKAAKQHWNPQFEQIHQNEQFYSGKHWWVYPNKLGEDGRMIVDLPSQLIETRAAQLYARNPTFSVNRRQQLRYALWDETPQSVQAMTQRLAQGVPSPEDLALMADIAEGESQKRQEDKLAKTLELLLMDQLERQTPNFKLSMKDSVVTTLVCGVSYIEVLYQRSLEKQPEVQRRLSDATDTLARLNQLAGEAGYGPIQEAEKQELTLLIDTLTRQPEVIVAEGVVYDYPHPTRVIPDTKCTSLLNFVGCDWVAVEVLMSSDDIKRTFNVCVATPPQKADTGCHMVEVYRVYHRLNNLVYYVCDGFPGFLREPKPPVVNAEGFFPIATLMFNKPRLLGNPYPRSNVRRMMPIAMEISRTMEALREHRAANRPRYYALPGTFSENEKRDLSELMAHEVLVLKNAAINASIPPILPLPVVSIDPNLYALGPLYEALERVMGLTEAPPRQSATQSVIENEERTGSLDSQKEDLEDTLTFIAETSRRVIMAEMTPESVTRVVGRGALWRAFSREEIAQDLYVTIKAGSAGRPNMAKELTALERATPLLVQTPGVSAGTIARMLWSAMGQPTPFSEFYVPNLPSLLMTNRQAQPSTGDPITDPNMQAGEGAFNKVAPERTEGAPAGMMTSNPNNLS